MKRDTMRLRILLPTEILLEAPVRKIVAEAPNGFFCLLPRHVDFVTALVPGILSYEAEDGRERFAAVDEGILVKVGRDVRLSCRDAVAGLELERLERAVADRFRKRRDQERKARSSIARIEANFVRRFLEIQPHER